MNDNSGIRAIEGIADFNQIGTEPDWEKTISNLMMLAKEAAKAFDYDRAIDYLRTLEEIWDSTGLPQFLPELRFELHREKGKAYASQGKLDAATEEYQKILKFCRDSAHLNVKSETFSQIGQLLGKQGDHDRALGYLQRAIGAYRRLGNNLGLCRALRNLGVIYVELGEFEEAEITYEEAIETAGDLNDPVLYADLVNNLGAIMNMKGNWRRALELYRDSLAIYAEQNEIRKSAYAKNNVAITLAEQEMNDEAFSYFQEAHETAIRIKDASLGLIVDINLADLYLKKGMYDQAEQHCSKAEQYLVEANLTNGHLVETMIIKGRIGHSKARHDDALLSFNEALELSRQLSTQFLEAEVLHERGILHREMERHLDALTDLEASYRIYTNLKAEGKREKTESIINSIEILYLEIFDSMAQQVDFKDKYTKGHSDRVASLALLLAKDLGLSVTMQKTIAAGSLLHDIGKTRISDDVLKKPGRLSDDEFKQIKKHPELGVELLRGKEFPWDIKPLILHHHERIDGTGYPLGMKGEDIPLGARIICIADVFDALTSDRVYRPAFDIDKALSIMNDESGTTFDPVLLKCFVSMVKQGTADPVINSRTRPDEMYSIWSQCMVDEDGEPEPEPAHQPVYRAR